MKTWLLTWNVDLWAWDDPINGYKEIKNDIDELGHAYCKWTCGRNKSIQKGDRIFLIKLGSYPKGIVASGYAATEVFEGIHWNVEKRDTLKARRIYVDFDCIRDYQNESILTFDILNEISNSYKWSSQSSGVLIPDEIASKLENEWITIQTIK